MTPEFNREITKKLNSISELAVETAPVSDRLRKLISIICDLAQVPAVVLLLSDDSSLSPQFLITGKDEKLVQALRFLNLEEGRNEKVRHLLPANSLASPASLHPHSWQVTDAQEQTYKFAVLPLIIGRQPLGAIALATPAPENLLSEKSSLLSVLAEQVGLLLLVFKSSPAETAKPSAPGNDSWFTEEFLATLSHELRAPLHAILGWVSVLQHPATNKETWDHALKTIERSARAQSSIINDLLEASFCFNQQLHLNKRPVAIHSILQQVIKTLVPVAEQKGISFTPTIQLTDDYVLADAERLRQVFWHLLSNAIKFTAPQGQIQLLAQRAGDNFELTLVDSGIGIASEFMPYVFDPFRQENATTTRKFGGLGLGLAIARRQIELHGGSIEVKSAGKNQGTTVIVRLPLESPFPIKNEIATEITTASEVSGATKKRELEGLRVLVVDDQTDSLEIVSTILQNFNSEVQTATSAEEALDVLKHWEPDILISDIQMPGIDGYELMRRIRRDKPTFRHRIAAIALTAYSRAEDRLKALASGFHTHLSKPVDPRELVAVISSLATQSRRTYSLI